MFKIFWDLYLKAVAHNYVRSLIDLKIITTVSVSKFRNNNQKRTFTETKLKRSKLPQYVL